MCQNSVRQVRAFSGRIGSTDGIRERSCTKISVAIPEQNKRSAIQYDSKICRSSQFINCGRNQVVAIIMDELKTDKGVFSPEDFLIWQDGGILDITPKFQRRGVWRPAIKSFFIDTLLRGMTVPPIYLRITQNETKTNAPPSTANKDHHDHSGCHPVACDPATACADLIRHTRNQATFQNV